MTPLEIAKGKNGKIEWCEQCPKLEIVNETLFCGESGKVLLPVFAKRQTQGNGPMMGCSMMKWKRQMRKEVSDGISDEK